MDNQTSNIWSLQNRISKLLQDVSTSDVEFLIGKPPVRYHCHKIILAAGSPVFETMFYGTIRQKSPVCVPDVTPTGFSLVLQYLYTDSLSIQDEYEAFEAAYPAKKYMIKSMFIICEKFLLKNLVLNAENIFTIYEEASFLEMKKLQEYCLRYISRHTKEIFLSQSFLKTSKKTCLEILTLDLLNIESEVEIIQSLWLWGEQQCKDKGIKCTEENIREHTKEFLKHIRFLTMNMNELVSILRECHILDITDEMSILWNFAMPSTRKDPIMPPNICSETKTRSLKNSKRIMFPGVYSCHGNVTTFLTEDSKTNIQITVTGFPITVIGVVIAFRPIPCYSKEDRSLKIEICASNFSSNAQTSAKSIVKHDNIDNNEEQEKFILLDDYISIDEKEDLLLTIVVSGEGIRFMQYTEEIMLHNLEKSKVCLKLDQRKAKNKTLFAIKELRIM